MGWGWTLGKEHSPGKTASYKRLVLSFSAIGAAGDSPSLQSRKPQVTLHRKGFLPWGVGGGGCGELSVEPYFVLGGVRGALMVVVASAERFGVGGYSRLSPSFDTLSLWRWFPWQ